MISKPRLFGFSPRSIGQRLLIMMSAIAIASSVLTAAALYINENITARKDQKIKIQALADVLAPNLAAALIFEDYQAAEELIAPLQDKASIVSATVSNNVQMVVAEVQSTKQPQFLVETTVVLEKALLLDNQYVGLLHIETDASYLEQRRKFYSLLVIVLLIVNGSISLTLAYFLSNRFTAPIMNLANLARRVSKTGNYNLRATRISADEVADLTDHFNEMLEKIESRDSFLETQVENRTHAIAEANKKLQRQALYDPLTQLPNRRFFYNKLEALINQQDATGIGFTVFFIDLDGFKEINDTYGHDQGDILLKNVGKRLRSNVRKTDFVARLGGDEFTVILDQLENTEIINVMARKILDALTEAFQSNSQEMFVSGSIGITRCPDDGNNIEVLTRNADQAMYAAKHAGRNCYYHFNNELAKNLSAKKVLSNELRKAQANNEFVLHYQPIVCINTGEVKKLEALIRWNHPKNGLVYPHKFIDAAEELGIINEITQWSIPVAFKQLQYWRQHYYPDLKLSLNLSPTQFKQQQIWLDQCEKQLKALDLPGSAITIEITESVALNFDDQLEDILKGIKSLDMNIALDDFGVGYSSLSHLQRLEVDTLKLDKSFVENMHLNPKSLAMCKAIIMMAHELGIDVVAEGVENSSQFEMLQDANCNLIQGFFFSEAVPEDEIDRLFSRTTTKIRSAR